MVSRPWIVGNERQVLGRVLLYPRMLDQRLNSPGWGLVRHCGDERRYLPQPARRMSFDAFLWRGTAATPWVAPRPELRMIDVGHRPVRSRLKRLHQVFGNAFGVEFKLHDRLPDRARYRL